MKKLLIGLLALGSISTFATDIFVKATKDELIKVPKTIKHSDCQLNISSKRFKEFEQEQASGDLRDSLVSALEAKGYSLNFVDYQIKIGIDGYVLESDNGPGTGSDKWLKGDLIADLSLHVVEKGGYVNLSRGDRDVYSGKNRLRDYCEVFYQLGSATQGKKLDTKADLRLTKRSFLNEKIACKKALKQALKYVPACIKH